MATVPTRTTQYKLATVISRIIDPPIILPLVTILGIARSDIAVERLPLVWAFTSLFIIVPIISALWLLKKHIITNWDITNRKERIRPLLILSIFLAICYVGTMVFHHAYLTSLVGLYLVWMIGFLMITLVWKISGHTSISALAIGLILLWYGAEFTLLLALLPIIAWARYIRKDHTALQLIAGILYSFGLLAIFSRWVY